MLGGEKVVLVPLERGDLIMVATWRNNPTIRHFFFNPLPIALSGQDRWYDAYLSRGDSLIFIIIPQGQEKRVGMVSLDRIDHHNQSAEYGRMLIADPADQGKGYALDATLTLLRYAFMDLNLNRLYLKVFADNSRAIHLYEHCGFQHEGIEREAIFLGGFFHNIVLMAILRNEFASRKTGAAI